MTSPTSREAAILLAAQEFVDDWLHSPHRRPFNEAVAEEERRRFFGNESADQDREAFRKVANAIRVGYGHTSANPRPLLEIARRVLRG